MNTDLINGLFELIGGFFIISNCFRIYKDKSVKGINISTTGFFSAWGVWNLIFYPANNLWFSFIGGLVIVIANLVWIGMSIYYLKKV